MAAFARVLFCAQANEMKNKTHAHTHTATASGVDVVVVGDIERAAFARPNQVVRVRQMLIEPKSKILDPLVNDSGIDIWVDTFLHFPRSFSIARWCDCSAWDSYSLPPSLAAFWLPNEGGNKLLADWPAVAAGLCTERRPRTIATALCMHRAGISIDRSIE